MTGNTNKNTIKKEIKELEARLKNYKIIQERVNAGYCCWEDIPDFSLFSFQGSRDVFVKIPSRYRDHPYSFNRPAIWWIHNKNTIERGIECNMNFGFDFDKTQGYDFLKT